MINDKAMIIIAVSNYDGYIDLPGAITSAKKIRKWAEQSCQECNYKVLYLADDIFKKIDTQLVKEKVNQFLDTNHIDRLVVYFAGHGIVRSAGSQFWLLTDANKDIGEGINVEAFRRGLEKYNISQLCIIGDACRNTSRTAIEFQGHPIVTPGGPKKKVQLDRFLSTGLGESSFQINETNNEDAFCLFSSVLINGLTGDCDEAIEKEYHEFKPCVTNHKLAEYVEKEVKARAAKIGENMEPDTFTGIRPSYNYYKLCEETKTKKLHTDLSEVEKNKGTVMAPIKKVSDYLMTRKKFLSRGKKDLINSVRNINIIHSPPIICDFLPTTIATPTNTYVHIKKFDGFYAIEVTGKEDAPLLIHQDNHWVLTPCYPNVSSVIYCELPGDLLFFDPLNEVWDHYLSDFSNLDNNAPLRAADASIFADRIRVGKEKFPHQSVVAGYLYEFSCDYSNIARTAHYMRKNIGVVPFDLGLLCANKIRWKKTKNEISAFADLPEVESSDPLPNEKYRPNYTRTAFRAKKDVRLWGICPIFTQGWDFFQTESYLDVPKSIKQIGEKMGGRSAAKLDADGLELFIKEFHYHVVEAKDCELSHL